MVIGAGCPKANRNVCYGGKADISEQSLDDLIWPNADRQLSGVNGEKWTIISNAFIWTA